MGTINTAIEMLFILKRNKRIKIKELANQLEVSEKQVKRYKEQLEGFFYIESIKGPNGGYELKDEYFPFREILSENEINALNLAVSSVDEELSKNDINLKRAIEKINFTILKRDESLILNEQIIPFSRPKSIGTEIIKMHDEIYNAIIKCLEIEIKYLDNKGVITKRVIRPYKYIRYKGEYYIVAICLSKNEIRYFKLVRIKEYNITNNKFLKDPSVEEKLKQDRENSMGIFSGETYDIQLEIAPPMANSIKERIWVDNQVIIEKEGGYIEYKAFMKNSPELIAWILSMGEAVKVLSPDKLRQEVKNKLKKDVRKNLMRTIYVPN